MKYKMKCHVWLLEKLLRRQLTQLRCVPLTFPVLYNGDVMTGALAAILNLNGTLKMKVVVGCYSRKPEGAKALDDFSVSLCHP